MAHKPAARQTDITYGPVVLSGSPNVHIGGPPAARIDDQAACAWPQPPHGPEKIVEGAPTILVNGKPLAYQGSALVGEGDPNEIRSGCANVIVNTSQKTDDKKQPAKNPPPKPPKTGNPLDDPALKKGIAASPMLQRALAYAKAGGWQFAYGKTVTGAFANPSNRTIVIDDGDLSAKNARPLIDIFAHEVKHAESFVQDDKGMSRAGDAPLTVDGAKNDPNKFLEDCIRNKFRDEGRADAFAQRVGAEIRANDPQHKIIPVGAVGGWAEGFKGEAFPKQVEDTTSLLLDSARPAGGPNHDSHFEPYKKECEETRKAFQSFVPVRTPKHK